MNKVTVPLGSWLSWESYHTVDTIESVTTKELRKLLCGDAGHFTLPTRTLKDRLGNPVDIRILSRWCKTTGRDVVLMTFLTEEGNVEVFCPIGFLNGEETVLDGWIGATKEVSTIHKIFPHKEPLRGVDHLRGLFDEGSSTGSAGMPGTPDSQPWRKAEQRSFGDPNEDDELRT